MPAERITTAEWTIATLILEYLTPSAQKIVTHTAVKKARTFTLLALWHNACSSKSLLTRIDQYRSLLAVVVARAVVVRIVVLEVTVASDVAVVGGYGCEDYASCLPQSPALLSSRVMLSGESDTLSVLLTTVTHRH